MLSKSKMYLVNAAKKKKVPAGFKEINWVAADEVPLLDFVDAMLQANGNEGLDRDSAPKSANGEILLYESTIKYTKQGEDKERSIPVMMYYNPRTQRGYNTLTSGSCKDETKKLELMKVLLDHMVNMRMPIGDKTSNEAFEKGKGLNIYVGDFVWGSRQEEGKDTDGSGTGETIAVWHCALPARIEVAE